MTSGVSVLHLVSAVVVSHVRRTGLTAGAVCDLRVVRLGHTVFCFTPLLVCVLYLVAYTVVA